MEAKVNGKAIQGIIRTHRDKNAVERKEWDVHRSWYLSEHYAPSMDDRPSGSGAVADEDEINLETNYPYAYIDTMIANVCPTNPQVTALARQSKNVEAAKFREALINENFRLNKLHQKLWKLATHVALCGRGIVKTTWDFKRDMPVMAVIDPRHFFYDRSVPWEESRYSIEVTVLTRKKFDSRTKKQGRKGAAYNPKVAEKARKGSYPTWLRDTARDKSMIHQASKEVYDWVVVYEFYDYESGTYSHWLEDVEEPLFQGEMPYRFLERPYTMLVFNDNMTDSGGVSDIKLIASAQERLNEIDTLELWHAHTSISTLLVNKGMVDNFEDFITALMSATQPGMAVGLEGKEKAPMRDLIGQTPTPQFAPSFDKMRERCIQIIEFILGIPAYSRGRVGVADVATEVALADTATRTRNGRRIKAVQDVVQNLAKSSFVLYEEFMSDDTLVVRLMDTTELLEVDREKMNMRNPETEEGLGFAYDYDVVPYSPTENNRLLQLQKLQEYWEVLIQAEGVDKKKLVAKILTLLQVEDIALKEGDQPAAPEPGAPVPLEAEGNADTIATGALPEGSVATPGPGDGFAGASAGLKAGLEQAGL
jgi:hypothetical protein